MKASLRPVITLLIMFTLLFGGLYPAVSTVVLQALFPAGSQGSLITGKDGNFIGSELIGQPFSKPEYFWGRLSATAPFAYNAAASGGSNFGANHPDLLKAVQGRVDALKKADPGNKKPIPVDLVTASASGLDPHISPAAADYQLSRVAHARGLPEAKLRALVERYTEGRGLGVFGEPGVNVLKLNLALDGKL